MSTNTNTIRPTEFRAMQKGEIPAPSNKTKKNTRKVNDEVSPDVTAVVETAFVPGSVEEVVDKVTLEKRTLSSEEKMAALFDSLSAEVISTPVFALPSNGEHSVVIMSYELKNGYRDNSDYFLVELKEPSKNICWNITIPATSKGVMEFLEEVNMYSKGVVYKMNPAQAFGKLETAQFRVWTQQFKNDKGEDRTKTYSNPVKYEKFARFVAYQEADKKQKDAEYKAKKAQQDKAPWEE